MDQAEILKLLSDIGAIITNSHVVYTSGRHGSAYVNKDAIYPHTEVVASLCREMAASFKEKEVDVVAGPTVGAVILTQWIANYLSKECGREILAAFAEADDAGKRIFKRGYDKLISGKKVLVVEDVLTTGGSIKKVIDIVRDLGGEVVGCLALCNRGRITEKDIGEVPYLKALINIDLDSWSEAECPLCKKGIPINTDVGKGARHLMS